jgi:hypothetical protein
MNSNVLNQLQSIFEVLSSGKIPQANFPWNLHDDVFIVNEKLKCTKYRNINSDFLVTPHYLEISWLMMQLRDIYYNAGELGHQDRRQFFLPIIEVGMKVVEENPEASAQELSIQMFKKACTFFDVVF